MIQRKTFVKQANKKKEKKKDGIKLRRGENKMVKE